MTSWLRRDRRRPKPPAGFTDALSGGDPAAIEQALIAASPEPVDTLDGVLTQLADAEQVRTLEYWQKSRWGRSADTQALSEMQRVFAKGPRWRDVPRRKDRLPPLYPD